MSVLDGKLAGQHPVYRFNSGDPRPVCSCCNILMLRPIQEYKQIKGIDNSIRYQVTYNYIGSQYYIYETKSGRSVVYCSKRCRDKHNHRFN